MIIIVLVIIIILLTYLLTYRIYRRFATSTTRTTHTHTRTHTSSNSNGSGLVVVTAASSECCGVRVAELQVVGLRANVGLHGEQPVRDDRDDRRRRVQGAQVQGQVRLSARVDHERLPQSAQAVQHHQGRRKPRLQGLRRRHAHRLRSTVHFRLRNDLYCVEWDVKLYYTIPYYGTLSISLATYLRQTADQ